MNVLPIYRARGLAYQLINNRYLFLLHIYTIPIEELIMITKEEVEHVGWLARIEIDSSEADAYAAQLNSVLDYFGQLDEVDTEDVPPTHHVEEMYNVLRQDVVKGSLTQEEALANTEYKQDGYFKAPSIM